MAEARYSGTKVVVVSPDFADNTKFADEWCRLAPGTDGALAMAMGHVILSKGIQSIYFKQAGFDVTGLDLSQEMLPRFPLVGFAPAA